MQLELLQKGTLLVMLFVAGATHTVRAQAASPNDAKAGEQGSAPSPSAGNAAPPKAGPSLPGGPPAPFPEAESIAQPEDEDALVLALKQLATRLALTGQFSGSILVAANGNTLLDDAWGMAEQEPRVANTPQTSYDVGSVGKLLTQLAILQLVEARKLTLDDPFGKYLVDYPDRDIAGKVTVRQLLLHTSGMGDFFDRVVPGTDLGTIRDLKGFLPLFAGKPLEFSPDSATRYSNAGYIVLGLVVEAVSGEDYYTYVQRHLLLPAGMTHSGFFDRSHLPAAVAHSYDGQQDVTGTHAARGSSAGGLQATAADLLKLVQSINAGKLIGPGMVKVLRGLVPRPPNTSSPADETKLTAYGIGGGAPGVSAQLVVEAADYYTWIILCNGSPPMAMAMGATVRRWIEGMPR